jgi:hypothetical protein
MSDEVEEEKKNEEEQSQKTYESLKIDDAAMSYVYVPKTAGGSKYFKKIGN